MKKITIVILKKMDTITIAILAKEKGHVLPTFLKCIENQTFPKNRTYIYIRSNNNKDNTSEILQTWVNQNKHLYIDIYEDYTNVEQNIEQYSPHEWNSLRFKILGKIRKDSIIWALNKQSHYFVVDCDNFIFDMTLETLHKTKLPVVSPLLKSSTYYSNFHNKIDDRGYFVQNTDYYDILNQKIKTCISMDVVHCTYFIRREYLEQMEYIDNTERHEYVIFSHNCRTKNILQFLDTRNIYGYITFADTKEDFEKEPWFDKFYTKENSEKFLIMSPQAGFGNRLRSLASGILLALQTNRTFRYVWEDTNEMINLKHFKDYFEETIFIYDKDNVKLNSVYSEWKPEDYWYQKQSGGQRKFNFNNVLPVNLNLIKNDTSDIILIETSNQLISDEELYQIYKTYFIPKEKYKNILNTIPEIETCLSIRRGNLLQYFPDSNQSFEELSKWIISSQFKQMVIFSDDHKFRDNLREIFPQISIELNLEPFEVAFMEFLIMAFKCKTIYGTPHSSFSEQASIFGGKFNHNKTLSIIIPKSETLGGFFSNCSLILNYIVDSFNANKKLLPINTDNCYSLYNPGYTKIMKHFFKEQENEISYNEILFHHPEISFHHTHQFKSYQQLDYINLNPLIHKYFTPSNDIIALKNNLINEYCIQSNEYCAVYYRGTDKITEIELPSFETFYLKIMEIKKQHPTIKFIVQSDTKSFILYIKQKIPDIIIMEYVQDSLNGLHNDNKPENNFNIIKRFLAIILILSECKYIICGFGNCSLWMALFRGKFDGIHQLK